MAEKIKSPRMRLPRSVQKDKIIKIKVKFDHPSFVGLGIVDDKNAPLYNRSAPVTFIRNMFIYYGDDLVSRFRMSSAIANNPLFTFKLRATKEAPIKIVFVDNFGERWETAKNLQFKA